jgi:hypothetical protein
MKLESRTMQILKNFSTINPSLMFKPGSTLNTMSPNKTVLAKASIKEQIPSSFAIYDLSKFLGVLSLFDQPELQVEEKQMVINGGQQKVRYTFASPDAIVIPSEKEVNMPETEIKFKLTAEDLTKVMKAMGVMQLPEIAIVGEGGEMSIQAIDSKNPSADSYRVVLGENSNNFKMIFKAENIKIMPGDYDVSISSKGIGHFKGNDVEYYIATEANSTFG